MTLKLEGETTAEVVGHIRWRYPEYTLQQIGDMVGVSRERVRQVLKRDGLKTAHRGWMNRPEYRCRYCSEVIQNRYNRVYCNRVCYSAHLVQLAQGESRA